MTIFCISFGDSPSHNSQPPFFFPRPFWPVDVLSPEEEAELEAGTDNEFKADLWLLLESAWESYQKQFVIGHSLPSMYVYNYIYKYIYI